jgi:hypothetical protein
MMERDEMVSLALARVRKDFTPSQQDKARVRGALGLQAPAATPGAGPFARPSRWAALKASGLLGAAAGALLLGSGVGLGFWWGDGDRAAERETLAAAQEARAVAALPARAAAPAQELALPAADVEPAEEMAAEPAAASAPEEPVEPARAQRTAPRAARTRSTPPPLTEELGLLRRVERALRARDAALALALLRELDTRFPQTRLGEERLAARLMADCQQGSSDPLARAAARREALRFSREHQASVYSERVQAACEKQ